MQHALEADHLAAVAAMSAGRTSRRALVLRGSFWGLGHTMTLLAVCGVVLVLGERVAPRAEALLEAVVGTMLIVLGVSVFVTLWRRRPHVHVHEHEDGVRHIHVHTHVDGSDPHSVSRHRHEHVSLNLGRALGIGMVHGAAGSAALLVFAGTADTLLGAIGYIVAFGLGSILGMASLSFVASYPLRFMALSAGWFNTAATISIGSAAVFVGGRLFAGSWGSL